MGEFYNPVVRTFCRLRAALLGCLNVQRHDICPDVPLDVLIPEERRAVVWHCLRDAGIAVPSLELTVWDRTVNTFTVLKAAAKVVMTGERLPLSGLAYGATRPRVGGFPVGVRTVGELVMLLTSCREHRDSGYRWSRGDIALRVRLMFAGCLGVPLGRITEQFSFGDDLS